MTPINKYLATEFSLLETTQMKKLSV